MPFASPPVAYAAETRVEAAIVREVNVLRRRSGLRAVRRDGQLARVARRHCLRILRTDTLTHDPSLSERLRRSARRYGETLAWSPTGSPSDARSIVTLWLRSPGHRAILLDPQLRRVGVGRVAGRMGSQTGHAVTADFSS